MLHILSKRRISQTEVLKVLDREDDRRRYYIIFNVLVLNITINIFLHTVYLPEILFIAWTNIYKRYIMQF